MSFDNATFHYSHDNAIISYSHYTVEQAIDAMINFYIRHLPILDESMNLVGIVTASDLLRHIHSEGELSALNTPLYEVMSSNVLTIAPDTSIVDSLLTIYNAGVSCAPIVRDENIVGIITIKDTLKIDRLWDLIEDIPITQYSNNIGRKISENNMVSPNHSIWQVMDKVYMSGINQVVVMDDQRSISGVVTVLDVLETVLDAYHTSKNDENYLHQAPVEDIMFHSPLLVRAPLQLKLGKKLLLDHHDECLILSSYHSPRVIISERDFFNFLISKISRFPGIF